MVQGSKTQAWTRDAPSVAPNPGCSPGARRPATGLGEIKDLSVGIAHRPPDRRGEIRTTGTDQGDGVMGKHVELPSHAHIEQRLTKDRPVAGARHAGPVQRGRGTRDGVGSCRADRRRGKDHRHRERTLSTQPRPHPCSVDAAAGRVCCTADDRDAAGQLRCARNGRPARRTRVTRSEGVRRWCMR